MTINTEYPPAAFTPQPGAANTSSRVRAQALADVRSTLRNGEQLLLTLVIPLGLLVALTWFDFGGTAGNSSIETVAPGVIALAVMSTAFTSLAIATGFDRRSGALRLLGTTPLSRGNLLLARALSVAVIEIIQIALILATAAALGWRPEGSPLPAVVLVILGTAAFAAWAFVLAGALRAEATLAVANGIYLVLMLAGGVVIPASSLPSGWATVVNLLPSGALASGLRDVFDPGATMPWAAAAVLVVWAGVGFVVASRTFRWD